MTPKFSGELKPYKDRLWIYMGKDLGWKVQLSVLNCNKPRIWSLLVEDKNSTFHYLERTEYKIKLIYQEGSWVEFEEDRHTPDW